MARFIALIALSIPAVANLAFGAEMQSATPLPASELSMRREIFHNDRVTAFLLEIPPGQATPMHRHEKDLITIVVSGGQLTRIPYHHAPESQSVPPRRGAIPASRAHARAAE